MHIAETPNYPDTETAGMVSVRELQDDPDTVRSLIDHTNVDPTATTAEIRELCQEVITYDFRSAVVVPYHVPLVAEQLGDHANVVTVVGFPYGVQNTAAKRAEIQAVAEYVDEVDMVINRTAFANDDDDAVVADIRDVKTALDDTPLKCIIESPELSLPEVRHAAELVAAGGADFVKTAVGYSGPASADTVRAIHDVVGDELGIKASGGISSFDDVVEMVAAGATRIGASSGVEIVESAPS